ncbi:DNA-binding transcriptional ArsR family regulator [Peribacillus deserti]|uniref:DNA-binding transcriptional ArsR family regulator n=1 Tax=Peribacillus deserti TaxID=673318 RepID=A0ABS2QLR6_9BACI|nr:metalloregulator ArsR/SmtB family transcription factor [Peribacillus deserti]MBM7694108.1 DNA-binding transcriptional ArsR family regulator [Peribacillus deserti]
MAEKNVCEVTCVHEDTVTRVKEKLKQKKTRDVASIFKALADDNRIKIAYALSLEEELCVCDAANIIGASTAAASHHLRLLYNLGLAKYEKRGKMVYYSLDDDHVKQIIHIAFAHQEEGKVRV